MPLKMSPTLRSNRANQIGLLIAEGTVEIRSGAQPASVLTADAGTLLCTITLPVNCLTTAVDGVVSKNGDWAGVGGVGASTGTAAGHFRCKSPGGAAVLDGTITAVGGGGQMTLDNINVAQNQAVLVNSFSYTDGNA